MLFIQVAEDVQIYLSAINLFIMYQDILQLAGKIMRLCDKDIEEWLVKRKLIITPYPNKKLINGITVDIHLGNTFRIFYDHTTSCVDLSSSQKKISNNLKKVMSDEKFFSKKHPFFLKPKTLVLFSTLESIVLPNNLVGWLDGRSSLARLGLMVHVTSHRIDPGWNGNIVLEIFNAGNLTLVLSPKIKIAVLSFELLSKSVIRPYSSRRESKYKTQTGVVPSRIYKEDIL